MAEPLFNESLVTVIDGPQDTAGVEAAMANIMYELGVVKDTYAGALAKREKNFPTALEVGEVNVAIPHCDIEHVNADAVCVGILKEPVAWRRMDNAEATCDVRLVFMLALSEPHAHLAMIQKVIGIIQDQELACKLAASDRAGAYELLKGRLS